PGYDALGSCGGPSGGRDTFGRKLPDGTEKRGKRIGGPSAGERRGDWGEDGSGSGGLGGSGGRGSSPGSGPHSPPPPPRAVDGGGAHVYDEGGPWWKGTWVSSLWGLICIGVVRWWCGLTRRGRCWRARGSSTTSTGWWR